MKERQNIKNEEISSKNTTPEVQKERKVQNQSYFAQIKMPLSMCFTLATAFSVQLAIESVRDTSKEFSDDALTFTAGFLNKNLTTYHIIAMIFALSMNFAINNWIHRSFGVWNFILMVWYIFWFDTEISTTNFGGAVTYGIGIITLMQFIVQRIILITIKYLRRSPQRTLFVILLVGAISLYFAQKSCQHWRQGLFGKELLPSKKYCEVAEPTYCPLTYFEQLIDLSPLIVGQCKNQQKHGKKLYLKYLKNVDFSKRYFAYAGIGNMTEKQRVGFADIFNGFQTHVLYKTRSFDSLQQALSQGREIAFDLRTKEYKMKVTRNADLIEQRTKKREFTPYSKKVFLIFVDALGRAAFTRNLPKTAAWFQKRDQTQQSKGTEFFRFHSVKPYTFQNYMAFAFEIASDNITNQCTPQLNPVIEAFPCEELKFLPEEERDQYLDSNYIIFNQTSQCHKNNRKFDNSKEYQYKSKGNFRKKNKNIIETAVHPAGLISGRASTSCTAAAGDIVNIMLKYYYSHPADHEAYGYACDPYYHSPKNPFSFFSGQYSVLQRCLSGQSIAEHAIDYARLFMEEYQNDPTYFLLQFIEAHETTGAVLPQIDEPLSQFLEEMDEKGYFDDTLVVLFSDHGQHSHYLRILFEMRQFYTERMMPELLISTPKTFNQKYPELLANIQSNSQKLVHMGTFHYFLQTWMRGGNYQKKDQSLFNPNLPSDLSCLDAVDNIDLTAQDYGYDNICVCKKTEIQV